MPRPKNSSSRHIFINKVQLVLRWGGSLKGVKQKEELMKKVSLAAARNEKSLQGRTLHPKVELLDKASLGSPKLCATLRRNLFII